MNALQWRREFYEPAKLLGGEDKVVGHVDGDMKTVALAEPPDGALARFKLLTPPDIRVGDNVSYNDGEGYVFVGIVELVGTPYSSGVFNVDVRNESSWARGRVPCEHCTVIFRPRGSYWKVDEVLATLGMRGTSMELVGGVRQKAVKITRDQVGRWVATFVLSGEQVDEKTWNEGDHSFRAREVVRMANAWLFEDPVKVGDAWTMTINQGRRDVEVVDVKKLRYRIEYEMPNAGMMGSWQTGIMIAGKLYKR